MFRRFGQLGNETELFENNNSNLVYATIKVVDENNNPISNAQITLKSENIILLKKQTDSNGIAIIKANPDNSYTLIISGDKIEDIIISNYKMSDITLSAIEKKYLELKPEYIWLNSYNYFKENVDVLSNTNWNLS